MNTDSPFVNNPGQQSDRTRLGPEITGGLGAVEFRHPPGTFALTPASRIALRAICENQRWLAGIGLDWGCGTGCLAITAAKIAAVRQLVGLDIVEANIMTAKSNAALNGVADRVSFIVSDSYSPASIADKHRVDSLAGKVNFILANPPASEGDDGFGFRRVVLEGARRFLAAKGVVFLNISLQYGPQRIHRLIRDVAGFAHLGEIASTDWVPFDLNRPDLLQCLEDYVAEESRGEMEYRFRKPGPGNDENICAQSALTHFRATGESPLSKWQTHLFEFQP
jgi:SAM-dependent methyltransferase